jgi:hypothetical protein
MSITAERPIRTPPRMDAIGVNSVTMGCEVFFAEEAHEEVAKL